MIIESNMRDQSTNQSINQSIKRWLACHWLAIYKCMGSIGWFDWPETKTVITPWVLTLQDIERNILAPKLSKWRGRGGLAQDYRLIDWLVKGLVGWLIDWSRVWSIDWLIDQGFGRLIDWLIALCFFIFSLVFCSDLSNLDLKSIVGVILNIPNDYAIGSFKLPLGRRHWICIRPVVTSGSPVLQQQSSSSSGSKGSSEAIHHTNPRESRRLFYNLDSKFKAPQLIGNESAALSFLQEALSVKGGEMLVVVTKDTANWGAGTLQESISSPFPDGLKKEKNRNSARVSSKKKREIFRLISAARTAGMMRPFRHRVENFPIFDCLINS